MTTPTPSGRAETAQRETYSVDVAALADDILGIVWDVASNRETAVFRDGKRLVVGEPLCAHCDQPVADGPCGCEHLEGGR